MSVSLATKGILCHSSPAVGRATWGVLCNTLITSIPSFIVGPQVFCPEVLFNKTLDASNTSFEHLVVNQITPVLTSPDIEFNIVQESSLLNAVEVHIAVPPPTKLSSVEGKEQQFNKEDTDIYNIEDPELINVPDWKGLDECP